MLNVQHALIPLKGISMLFYISWQQRNTTFKHRNQAKDHCTQQNRIKTMILEPNEHTYLGASSRNCKDAIEGFGQPMINQRDCLRATPLYSLTHTRTGAERVDMLVPRTLNLLVKNRLGKEEPKQFCFSLLAIY